MIDLPEGVTSTAVVDRARLEGVLITPWSATRVRAVTHLDVDAETVAGAADAVRAAIERLAR
jgi:threonine aldolase